MAKLTRSHKLTNNRQSKMICAHVSFFSPIELASSCQLAAVCCSAPTLRVTLGMKYRIPSTEPNLPRIEPKVPKPKYSVPCSVPSSGEPNLPRYIRFCISVNRSTELVPNYASSSSCYVFVMYLWTTLLHIYSNLLM